MDKILLSHGGGGRKTSELIENVFQTYLNDDILLQMDDSAVLDDIVFTTDTFVVTPLFFPGGDIGRLAIAGTVNDLSVMGAKPLYLSCAFIIEEGFSIETLKKILKSLKESAEECGVRIVTGDTKVVEKGKCDGIFINTSGIGKLNFKNQLSQKKIVPGDRIIINGNLGLHGISVLIARNEF
ncbi:hydrogenase expression/formation protein HypE, partial [bacterium]|nr:hydrogenase expression/formation protein HypE [bacterium]